MAGAAGGSSRSQQHIGININPGPKNRMD
jgi:hypothetical protein